MLMFILDATGNTVVQTFQQIYKLSFFWKNHYYSFNFLIKFLKEAIHNGKQFIKCQQTSSFQLLNNLFPV